MRIARIVIAFLVYFLLAPADLNQAPAFGVQQDHAYFARGLVYKSKGNLAQARADFEAALRINPNNQSAKNALAALGQ